MAVVIDYIDHFRDRVVEGKKLGVEPICRVLNQAGVQIAPRTYYGLFGLLVGSGTRGCS